MAHPDPPSGAPPQGRPRLSDALATAARSAAAAAAVVPAAAVGMLWAFQERGIFPDRRNGESVWESPGGAWGNGSAKGSDGEPGLGFLFADPDRSAADRNLPAVVFLHGNATSARASAERLAFLPEAGFPTVVVEYPGYGGNPGSPGERSLEDAARRAALWARDRWPGRPLAAFGESIGSAPATRLATSGLAELLVLDSPFTSMAEAVRHHMPWVPAPDLLLRHPMENAQAMRGSGRPGEGRLLVLVAAHDPVVPARMGEELASAVPGSELYRARMTGHPVLPADRDAAWVVADWLRRKSRELNREATAPAEPARGPRTP